MPHIDNSSEGLRSLLARDHRELDLLFDQLSNALHADAREDALRLWAAFDDGLCRHMALEEKHILPRLQEQDAREVTELLNEHADIRQKLAELGVGVDLHAIPAQTVSDFIDQLRRHAEREDALVYRWAEANLAATERGQIAEKLSAASALRQRLLQLGRRTKALITFAH